MVSIPVGWIMYIFIQSSCINSPELTCTALSTRILIGTKEYQSSKLIPCDSVSYTLLANAPTSCVYSTVSSRKYCFWSPVLYFAPLELRSEDVEHLSQVTNIGLSHELIGQHKHGVATEYGCVGVPFAMHRGFASAQGRRR